MGGSKQTTNTQQTSSSNPYSVAQPAINDIIAKAQQYGSDASRFTPTQSEQTRAAVSGLTDYGSKPNVTGGVAQNVAYGGAAGYNVGLGTLANTAAGGNLYGNPYLDSMLDQQGQRTADIVNRQLSGAGRFGSNFATADLLGRSIGEQQLQGRYQNYNDERGRQQQSANTLYAGGQQAIGAANAADQSSLGQLAALGQAGQIQDAQAQGERQAALQGLQFQNSIISPLGAQYATNHSSGSSTTTRPTDWVQTGVGLWKLNNDLAKSVLTGGVG